MRRRSFVARGCGFAALFAASSSWAQIFKCPVNGVAVYQQAPCAGLGASGGRLMFRENGQSVPLARSSPEREPPPRVLGRTRLRAPKPAGVKSP
jgi:hypothetical protein